MFGLYIHIPFCRRKCSYCDFNSYAGMEDFHVSYVDALVKEIKFSPSHPGGLREVISIYLGGGTPTFLHHPLLERVLCACHDGFILSPEAEISIEANPETLDGETLRFLKRMGFNRLSIGIQSLNDRLLRILGRGHTVEEAVEALLIARKVGFENVNVDLIFGIPTESLGDWMRTLQRVIDLEPTHISTYSLEIHPGTEMERRILRGELEEVGEDEQADMYLLARDLLTLHGFEHYEISNFARDGYRCRHNLLYWENDDYLGFGAGAHSHLGNIRFCNLSDPLQYVGEIKKRRSARIRRDELTREMLLSETMFLNLRLLEGVDPKRFGEKFGLLPQDVYGEKLRDLAQKGLVNFGERPKLTEKGLLLANYVFSEFV